MNIPGMRLRASLLLVLSSLIFLSGCLPSFQRVDASITTLERLPVGEWVAVDLPAPAMSSDGSAYELNVKRGNSNNLIIFFGGGGAAWDASSVSQPLTLESIKLAQETGSNPGFYTAGISRFAPLSMLGILDARRTDNPFRDWTIVYLPYTTGDFHVGDNTVEYELEDGTIRVMHYNGYNNASTALQWIQTAMPDPGKLFVAGQSAGGFAAAIWFDVIASLYPEAEPFQYSDSSFMYAEDTAAIVEGAWNAQFPGRFGFEPGASVMDAALRHILSKYGSDVTVLHSETVADSVLPWFEAHLNEVEPGREYREGWSERMLHTYRSINADYPNFYLYLTDFGRDENGATTHTLSQADSYFTTSEEGVPLVQWLSDAVINGDPYDVGLAWLE